MEHQGCYYELFSPCVTKVRAVFAFLAMACGTGMRFITYSVVQKYTISGVQSVWYNLYTKLFYAFLNVQSWIVIRLVFGIE